MHLHSEDQAKEALIPAHAFLVKEFRSSKESLKTCDVSSDPAGKSTHVPLAKVSPVANLKVHGMEKYPQTPGVGLEAVRFRSSFI